MFAIVRTGGKQYRVAPGDKIVVEKIDGAAGDSVKLSDVLLAGEGADLKSTDGLVVSGEIIAQARADKVIVFKKKRRHNYRRKAGHRQQHTIIRITAIGAHKAEKAAPKKSAEPKAAEPKTAEKPAKAKADKAEAAPEPQAPLKAGPTGKGPDAEPPAKKKAAKAPAKKAAAPKADKKPAAKPKAAKKK